MNKDSKLKILLCDSQPRVLSRLDSWIQILGAEVVSSSDGVSALQIFNEVRPDILLVSQELNSMGGIELIEAIKKIVPSQAVVMMLNESDRVFKRAIDLQVDKYLNKPVEVSALVNAIESLAQEKLFHKEFKVQEKVLKDYKDAIDFSFSVSKHDKDGKIIYVNDLFCKSTNLTYFNAMQGLINPLHNRNENMDKVWEILKRDKVYKGRQIFRIGSEHEKIIDVTAVALLNERSEVYEYLVFTEDVTKLVYAARKVKNQELESRLEKINHQKKLNAMKDSFLTVFTHELKTPLNSIINFSEYVVKHLKRENFEKKERLLLQVEEIRKSGVYMLHMITNLMEAIRLKNSAIPLHLKTIDANNAMNALIVSKHVDIGAKSIVNETVGEVLIVSDEERFIQVLDHLISNAIKYAKREVVTSISYDEREFRVEIEDDGDGFSKSVNVFELFEQADSSSLTREGVGVGTGLFIVKQLCDKMGYSIELLDSKSLGGASVVVKGKRKLVI